MSRFRTGTKIEVHVMTAAGSWNWEPAKIGRMTLKKCGCREYPVPGYHLVEWERGGANAVHESGFRVIDKRSGYGRIAA